MTKKNSGLTHIGDTTVFKSIARDLKPATSADRKFLDTATAIRQQPDAAEAAFMARQLVQCTLPHTNPGKVEAWQRRSGNLCLVIQPGWDGEEARSIGIPTGRFPGSCSSG